MRQDWTGRTSEYAAGLMQVRSYFISCLFPSQHFIKRCVYLSSPTSAWALPNWLPTHQRARGGHFIEAQLTGVRSLIAMTSYLAWERLLTSCGLVIGNADIANVC